MAGDCCLKMRSRIAKGALLKNKILFAPNCSPMAWSSCNCVCLKCWPFHIIDSSCLTLCLLSLCGCAFLHMTACVSGIFVFVKQLKPCLYLFNFCLEIMRCEICCKRSAQAHSVLSRITGHRLKTDWLKPSGAVAYQVPAFKALCYRLRLSRRTNSPVPVSRWQTVHIRQ